MSTNLPTIYNTTIEPYEMAVARCGSPNAPDFDRVFDECCDEWDAAVDAADVHPPHPGQYPEFDAHVWAAKAALHNAHCLELEILF